MSRNMDRCCCPSLPGRGPPHSSAGTPLAPVKPGDAVRKNEGRRTELPAAKPGAAPATPASPSLALLASAPASRRGRRGVPSLAALKPGSGERVISTSSQRCLSHAAPRRKNQTSRCGKTCFSPSISLLPLPVPLALAAPGSPACCQPGSRHVVAPDQPRGALSCPINWE